MSIFKCKMCGGDLALIEGSSVLECEYCGTRQTVPAGNDEKKVNLFNRANRLRANSEFDKASAIYEQIAAEFPDEAEAYWGLCLCNYGIEYVDDPATAKKIPTCHRASFEKLSDDENFALAIEYADVAAQKVYRDEAREIERINDEILSISKNEKPYDVFICYKETDDKGGRTPDSVMAQETYDALTAKGLKVFFSRITLEDKLGTAYEPYIFAALNSSKVMLAFGTSYEYFHAVWVKNEWSRFLKLAAKDRNKKLIPCYRDIDPYDMPDEFKGLQAQDMGKLGAIQDLVRGVVKIVGGTEPKAEKAETNTGMSAFTAPLLKRATDLLESGDWQNADSFADKALEFDPECVQAYLVKLMAKREVCHREDLANCEDSFENDEDYLKTVQFCDDKLKSELDGYISHIKERNENARLTDIYDRAVEKMNSAKSEGEYKSAAETFKTIPDFKDADSLAEQCLDKAEICRKIAIYASGKSLMTGNAVSEYEAAVNTFRTISGWKDADVQINICQRKIEEIKAKEEADRLEAARKNEERRIAAEKAAKKRKKIIAITTSIVAVCAALVVVFITVIIPMIKYNSAMELFNVQKYEDAYNVFNSLSYKDSDEKAVECLFHIQKARLINVSVGSTIKFGFYEQDNSTSNGKEEIEWKVLALDSNKALLISRYALDCKPYNDSFIDTTWEECTLRTWLNDVFYNTAFGADYQKMIASTTVTVDKNPSYSTSPGNNTTDKVFLLSITEVNKYFSSDESRKCTPTDYAIAQGAYTSSSFSVGGKATCWWWLRSPGGNSNYAAGVDIGGSVRSYGRGVDYSNVAVRPALWINLGS